MKKQNIIFLFILLLFLFSCECKQKLPSQYGTEKDKKAFSHPYIINIYNVDLDVSIQDIDLENYPISCCRQRKTLIKWIKFNQLDKTDKDKWVESLKYYINRIESEGKELVIPELLDLLKEEQVYFSGCYATMKATGNSSYKYYSSFNFFNAKTNKLYVFEEVL